MEFGLEMKWGKFVIVKMQHLKVGHGNKMPAYFESA